MSTLRDFIKQYTTYSLGIAINRLASLLLLPLYTRFLTPADYGVLDILMTSVVLLQPLFMLGIDTSVQILFFSLKTKKQQNDLVMTSLVLVAVFGGVCALSGWLLAPTLARGVLGNENYTIALRLLCFDMWLTGLLLLFRNNFRIRQQPLIYNFVTIGQVVLLAGFNIVLVVVQQLGVIGIVTGIVLADLVITGFSACLVLKQHLQLPTLTQTLPLLRLGLPLLPVSAMYWVLNWSDRVFLAKLSTFDEIGVYGIANRLATSIGIFTLAVQLSWRPFALRIQSTPYARPLYATMPLYYFVGVGWIGLVIAAASPLLLQVFATKAYMQATVLLTPLILAQAMYGAYYIFSTGLEIVQRTYHITWTVFLAALVNTALNILLIPKLAALGASLATALSYGLATLCVGIVSQQLYPLPYDLRRLGGVTCCLLLSYGVMTGLFWYESEYTTALRGICVVLSGVVLLSFIEPELKMLWQRGSALLKQK
jgi:O-antigen/teichoic acid export membrane protein